MKHYHTKNHSRWDVREQVDPAALALREAVRQDLLAAPIPPLSLEFSEEAVLRQLQTAEERLKAQRESVYTAGVDLSASAGDYEYVASNTGGDPGIIYQHLSGIKTPYLDEVAEAARWWRERVRGGLVTPSVNPEGWMPGESAYSPRFLQRARELFDHTGIKSVPALPNGLVWVGHLGGLWVYTEGQSLHLICELVDQLDTLIELDPRWLEFFSAQADWLRGSGEVLRALANVAERKFREQSPHS